MPELPDEQIRDLAPELVAVIRAIIDASDGCVGHRQCAHSMKPWRDARRLLMRIDGEYYDLPGDDDRPGESDA
jgi:hypothetical protein